MGCPPICVFIYKNGIHVRFGSPSWIPNVVAANALKIYVDSEETIEAKNSKACSALAYRIYEGKKTGDINVDNALEVVNASISGFDSLDVDFSNGEENYTPSDDE